MGNRKDSIKMEKKCFIAGLPQAGKTTYIAALWDVIQREKGNFELQFTTSPQNASYLNEIWEYWMRMEKIERSKVPVPEDIKINVKRKLNGDELELDIPDFMGEQFQKIIDRTLPESIMQWIEQSDRMLYLINLLGDANKDDVDNEESALDGIDRTKEKEEATSLTPERMLDVSQNLMVLKYISSHSKIDKIAVGLSAWDNKLSSGKSPEGFLKDRAPVLYNFIKYHFRDHLFFGVSAQGFDYKDKEVKGKDMKDKAKQSNRAFIVYGEEKEVSFDLTRPFNYLIS